MSPEALYSSMPDGFPGGRGGGTTVGSTTTAHIEIAYDGPPGVMDVDELGPALIGIGALCKRTNELFNGDYAKVNVNVRSDFKTGSFGIDLDVVQVVGLVAGAVPLFTPENFKSATQIAEVIGLLTVGDEKAFTSLLGLIKWLRGSKVTKIEPKGDEFRIVNERGDNITITGDVGQLIINPSVREAAHEALKPLERTEITGFQVKKLGDVVDEVPDEAVTFFHHENPVPIPDASEVVEVFSDSTSRRAYEVIRPSFDPTLMWKMSDGDRHVDISVDDAAFLAEVKAGKYGFFSGTVVVGLYRIRSFRTEAGKVKTEYRLATMIEVRHARPPEIATLFATAISAPREKKPRKPRKPKK